MIDLHIHTTCSDGTCSVTEILKKANDLKLEVISITDHDNVNAYKELENINASDYYKGNIVSGVEVKTTFEDVSIEILGYNINVNEFENTDCVNDSRKLQIQNKYLQNYIKVGNSLGLKCDNNILIKDPRKFAAVTYFREISNYTGNYNVLPYLVNIDEKEFYRITSSDKTNPFYINETQDSLSIDYVINQIHKCGGKAFLAHLFEYKVNNHLEFLKRIIHETNIDGIECFHSSFTNKQTELLLNTAKTNNKYISGGSDYHGLNKPNINLGIGKGNLNIPYDVITNWHKFTKN